MSDRYSTLFRLLFFSCVILSPFCPCSGPQPCPSSVTGPNPNNNPLSTGPILPPHNMFKLVQLGPHCTLYRVPATTVCTGPSPAALVMFKLVQLGLHYPVSPTPSPPTHIQTCQKAGGWQSTEMLFVIKTELNL